MKLILAVNLLAIACGWYFLQIRGPLNELDSRMRFTELDRAQVINDARLAVFDPALAQDTRNTVPRWLAKAPIEGERSNARMVITFGANNVVIAVGALLFARFRRQQQAKVLGEPKMDRG